jgi:hypothetical protein
VVTSSACDPCDVVVRVVAEDEDATALTVEIDCCDVPAFQWRRLDTGDEFVLDRYAMWNDTLTWRDGADWWDTPVFDVVVSCVPLGLGGACFYTTADAVAFAAGSGKLYGVCK